MRQTPEALGYERVWEDDFNGNALDPQKWAVRGVGPRALGYVSPEAVTVADGCLKLHALRKNDRILLGAVGTQDRFMTRYGYFECRAQLQKSPGIWAAFWIQSTEIAKGEDPASYGAEIDILEFFKKLGTDIVSHNVHWAYGPRQQTTHGMQSYLKGVGEGFHTFALEWTPEKYVFFVDGYRFYEVTAGLSHIEEYMILSMEIPSKPEEIKATVFPDVFVVDYVRVYKKKQGLSSGLLVDVPAKPARPAIYDESADGAKEIEGAIARVKKENKHVLLMFGANWCGWCHRLHALFESNAQIAAKLKHDFVLVLVDVNNNHNADLNQRYGNPTQFGLPVLVVLDAAGKALTTQDTGTLEEGDHHDPAKVMTFLDQWSPKK